MKKLYVTMLSMLACGAAYALPVGNPSDASLLCDGVIWEGHCGDACDPCVTWTDAWSIRVGFYGDYVFNRHLKIDNKDGGDEDKIEHASFSTNAGFIALNIWDRLDLFTTLGATSFNINTNEQTFVTFGSTTAIGNGRFEVESITDFSWSVGARGTLWECGCTSLGAEAQYFYARPDLWRVTDDALASVYPSSDVDGKYQEWQVGLGLSHRINMFVPYIAVKWSGAKLNFDRAAFTLAASPTDTATLYSLKNDKQWGYAVGVSLVDCEKASLTAEGRWGDEKGLYINGQIRF